MILCINITEIFIIWQSRFSGHIWPLNKNHKKITTPNEMHHLLLFKSTKGNFILIIT